MDSKKDLIPNFSDQNLMSRLRDLLLEKERAQVDDLTNEVALLEDEIQKIHDEIIKRDELVPLITDQMGDITMEAVNGQRNKMAKALSPIIGEATRYQIQESSDEMVEALYPIVGAAVTRAVGEALNDLRKRIDAQIRPNSSSVQQNILNRMRGIDPADLALRQALPFSINQLFLIQHDSGLVLEFVNENNDEVADSDLVSSMLTAIRSFVNDSFSPDSNDDELYEVFFGEDRIIIESGTAAYAAAVISGVEPEGFRSMLRAFVNDLHIQHKHELESYDGDQSTLPNLLESMNSFVDAAQHNDKSNDTGDSGREMSAENATRLATTLGIISLIILLSLCLFYTFFTYQLLPYAFGNAATAPTVIPATPVAIIITATPQPTIVPTATPAPWPAEIELAVSKWSRTYPDADAPQFLLVPNDQRLSVIKTVDDWVEVEWEDPAQGLVQAWIKIDWIGEIK